MAETGPEGATGATAGAARPEGSEGRTPAVEAATAEGATLSAAVSTVPVPVLVSVGTHRHHSIQSLI